MIRVFIADDHEVVRVGLRKLIEQEPGLQVVGEADNGRQVLLAEGRAQWDVLVLDLSLPRVNGIEVLRRLKEELPNLRVVIFSMFPESHYAARLREFGATAYVSKENPAERVVDTILAVSQTPSRRAKPVIPDESEALPHASLSPREYQIFLLISQGASVSDIAAELDLTASTVSVHLHKIKQKLKVRSVGEIVRYAHRVGLLGDGNDEGGKLV